MLWRSSASICFNKLNNTLQSSSRGRSQVLEMAFQLSLLFAKYVLLLPRIQKFQMRLFASILMYFDKGGSRCIKLSQWSIVSYLKSIDFHLHLFANLFVCLLFLFFFCSFWHFYWYNLNSISHVSQQPVSELPLISTSYPEDFLLVLSSLLCRRMSSSSQIS